jgi:hypothetical protein
VKKVVAATCGKCGEWKPIDQFRPGPYVRKDGVRKPWTYCRECDVLIKREWTARNPDKVAVHNRRRVIVNARKSYLQKKVILWAKHGLTPLQFATIRDSQDGRCGVCWLEPTDFTIDHDHKCCPGMTSCGACVRGLLCHPCNRGLGFLRESSVTLARASRYVA